MLTERVRATGLVAAGEPVVVLLSGGRDSTCLLDVCVAIAGAAAVRALHVDYGLRGAASDADREHCAALCEQLEVALEVVVAGPRPEGNLHTWARGVRYDAAARLALGARVAAGHTLSDQVETILYRLATSPGRRALLGMPVARGSLVRPLLAAEATRVETAAHCFARGLSFREDASNVDRAFARAR
ncbi:MAG: tilS, partial [Conexibacter sp.]|nr:tilS [Conexibacter sp.]